MQKNQIPPAPPRVFVYQTGQTTWWVKLSTNGTIQDRTRHRTESAAHKAAAKLRAEIRGW